MIENLSQLKKYLTVGAKLKKTYCYRPDDSLNKIRKIGKVQNNSIMFDDNHWVYWQAAGCYSFYERGFDIFDEQEDGSKILILKYEYC